MLCLTPSYVPPPHTTPSPLPPPPPLPLEQCCERTFLSPYHELSVHVTDPHGVPVFCFFRPFQCTCYCMCCTVAPQYIEVPCLSHARRLRCSPVCVFVRGVAWLHCVFLCLMC